MQTLKKFIKYYKPYKAVFFIDLLCATIISAIDLAFPQLLSHADQKTPFCRSTGKIISALIPITIGPFGGIYHTDCVQVLCDICGAHDGSEDGARHEKGAFRPI